MEYELKFNLIEELEGNRARFSIEPLARGFGHTLGNSLRRVMLSHLSGAAITKVKIEGVSHEFSALSGVQEDVVQIAQNLKEVVFKMEEKKVTIVTLEAEGKGEVSAGDLHCPTGISVVNTDYHIATLSDKKSELELELTVEYGKGYQLPKQQEKREVGVIFLDANFSPIVLADYKVENTRVGRVTDLDKVVMDITTDGSITPKEGLQQSAAILKEYFDSLSGDTKVYDYDREEDKEEVKRVTPAQSEQKVYLEELELPTRVLNTLKSAGFQTVDDLEEEGPEGLREVKNVGPKTVELLTRKIENLRGK